MHKLLVRSLLAAAPLVLAAGTASAQNYIGAAAGTPPTLNGGPLPSSVLTVRARNLTNINPSANDELFVGLPGFGLDARLRDSYSGTWDGSGATRAYGCPNLLACGCGR